MANSTIKRGADSCGFPDPIVLHATEDLDNVKLTGFYRWASTNKPTHYPLNESGKMIVLNRSADEVDQLYFCANAVSGMKLRTLFGTTWSGWYNVAIEEDISSHVTPGTGTTLQKAKRIGNFVLLQLVSAKVTTANTYQQIATIDSGYRPAASHLYGGTVQCSSTNDFGYGFVQATSTGAVSVFYSKATSYGLQCTITYYIGS